MRALLPALVVASALGCTAEILPSQVALADTGAPLDAAPGLDVVTATTADVGPRDTGDGDLGPRSDAADASPEDAADGGDEDTGAPEDTGPSDTLEPIQRDARTGLDATPIGRDGGTIPDVAAASDT